LKTFFKDFILQDLIPRTGLCGNGFISQHCWVVDFCVTGFISSHCCVVDCWFVEKRFHHNLFSDSSLTLPYLPHIQSCLEGMMQEMAILTTDSPTDPSIQAPIHLWFTAPEVGHPPFDDNHERPLHRLVGPFLHEYLSRFEGMDDDSWRRRDGAPLHRLERYQSLGSFHAWRLGGWPRCRGKWQYQRGYINRWLRSLLETVIQYPCLRVYVDQIPVDLISRFFWGFAENEPKTSGWRVRCSDQLS